MVALPKLNHDSPEVVSELDLTNIKLDVIRDSVDTMSNRLNIKLGSIASMLSDFFVMDASEGGSKQEHQLYGINVKLGSIAMMLGEFFEEQRLRWTLEQLSENNDRQLPPREPDVPDIDPLDLSDLQSTTESWLKNILSAVGVGLLAMKFGVGDVIKESGIGLYITRAVTRFAVVGSGLVRMFETLGNMPVFRTLKSLGAQAFAAINFVGSKIIPFWGTFVRIGANIGKIIPLTAVVISIYDFMKGFTSQDNILDGVREGIAEVAAGWIGWPLNILRDIVSWATNKLGFDTSSFDDIDFVGIVKNSVRRMFKVITDLFTFEDGFFSDFDAIQKRLLDIIHLPINLAVNLVQSIFDIGDPEVPFNFQEFLTGVMASVRDWFVGLFNPDWDELAKKTAFYDKLILDFVDDLKTWFSDLFKNIIDSFPSWNDLKRAILPTQWYAADITDDSLLKEIRELEEKIKSNRNDIRRSLAGEDVFRGPESMGVVRAQSRIDSAEATRKDLLRELNNRRNQQAVGSNINIVTGGSTNVNKTDVNMNNFSSAPTSSRIDGF